MSNIDLNNVLSKLKTNLKADWIGLREVKETRGENYENGCVLYET